MIFLSLPLAPKPVPVVELFTSEGCSSCPSADSLLGRYASEGKIILLAFHVDYWDHLGWRDRFSSREATQRQEAYNGRFRLKTIYTPQAIVNGASEFLGNDENALAAALSRSGDKNRQPIRMQAKPDGTVTIVSPKLPNADVLIATIRGTQSTRVERGENAGATLTHVGIVKGLRRLGTAGSPFVIPRPGAGDSLVAFLQTRGYGPIIGAAVQKAP